MTPARTTDTVTTSTTRRPILARATRLSIEMHVANMIQIALSLGVKRMHSHRALVFLGSMATSANVKVLVEKSFATITVHIHTG
jgi:hypothetical protein